MSADFNKEVHINCYRNYKIIEDDHEDYSEIKDNPRIWNHPFFRQVIVMLCPVLCTFSGGVSLGMPTVLIPQLLASKEIELTKEMQSWLYSVHGISSWPGVIALPYLSQKYGRRTVYFSSSVIICVSWLLTYFAKSFSQFLVAEILQGYSIGVNLVIGIMILSEYADPKYRGIFLMFKSASLAWGIWAGNAIGTFTDSRNNCIVGLITGIISFLILIYIPEAPIWLAWKGDYEKCKKSFIWLRGSSERSISDFHNMFEYYSNCSTPKNKKNGLVPLLYGFWKTISSREFYLPFSLSIACNCLFQFSGKIVMTMYSLVLITEITHDRALAYKTMLVIDGISVIGMYVGCYICLKLKRRVLIISTTLTAVVIINTTSLLLFLSDYNIFKINNYVILSLLLLYSLSIAVGPVSVMVPIFAEIVPHKYKTIIISSVIVITLGLHTLLLKSNIFLMEKIRISGIFCFFGTASGLLLLFLYFYLPETKNKTLFEIERYFKSNTGGIYKGYKNTFDVDKNNIDKNKIMDIN